VSPDGDDIGEMPTQRLLDDAAVEAILQGRPVPSELAGVASAVGVLRETAGRPVRPSLELAEFIATGGAGSYHQAELTRWRSVSTKLAGMSLRLKLAAGVAAGLTGLTGAAAAAGELPPAVQAGVDSAVATVVDTAADSVEAAVEFVTPIEFPEERVSSKGHIDQPGKPDPLSGPVELADPLPYAVDAAVPPAIASPTPSPSPVPQIVPPVVEPTVAPTPSPAPEPSPEPSPTPTATPTPEPSPTAPPEPPPPPDPPDTGTLDDAQAATGVQGEQGAGPAGDPQQAPAAAQ
jgi:hypothetical protein